ncbi:flagellar hook-length control protein FliK [Salinimonas lutimaris]|uniref:flagellar hook-length control protein FliK n=1 Tax=Salinimonas lutimaris TaxID=914153 RepID=UPI0010C136A1|nr:flagellar hook-length control protein FliK [Salinimonas lutimaris]
MTIPIQISQLNPLSQFAGHIPDGTARLPVTDSAAGLQVSVTLQQAYLSLKLAGQQGRLYSTELPPSSTAELTGTRFIGKDSPSTGLLSQLFPVKHTVALTTTAQAQLAARLASQTTAQALPAVSMQVSGLSGHILSLSALTPTAALRLPLPGTLLSQLTLEGHSLPSSATLKIADNGRSVQVTLDKAHQASAFNIPLPTRADQQAVKQAMLLQQLATGGVQIATQTTDIQQAIKPALPASLMNQVTQHHAARIELNGKYLNIHTQQARPLARLTFSPEIAARLPSVPAPDSASRSLLTLPLSTTKPAAMSGGKTGALPTDTPNADNTKMQAREMLPGEQKLSGSTSSAQPDPAHFSKPYAQLIQGKIQALARQLLADTGSTNKALVSLLSSLHQLSDSHQHPQTTGQARELGNRLLALLPTPALNHQTSTAGMALSTEPDPAKETQAQPAVSVDKLKSLLTGPELLLTPSMLTSPAPANTFVGALVSLLQITLAGRALIKHPELAKNSSILSSDSTGSADSRITARTARDFATLDAQHDTIKQIKTLLANQQSARLGNAEARLQGQEQLYFLLPVASHRQSPTEVLIKRDNQHHHENDKNADTSSRIWNLTMKLDAGTSGQILAKTKISGPSIELNLYTSTDGLLNTIRDTLPYLLRRLTAHGLEVAGSSVQRGQIPTTLAQHNYHLFETLA